MQRSSALGSWAWGVNGFFTVIGTVLALIFGMMIGFRIVLVLASVCYLGALLAVLWLSNLSTDRDMADFRPSLTVESTS
jgi:hypothetical protein